MTFTASLNRDPGPKPPSQNADHLPAALVPLCQVPQWVLWRWELRYTNGAAHWTKPPYQPDGTKAASDDSTTWSSCEAVIEALNRGGFDGIGLMLPGTTLTTIDLDHCLDGSGQPDSWAAIWIERANGAYVERTPSGEGLRIIGEVCGPVVPLQRRWPIDNAREGAAIEVYRNCRRYITITGNQIGDCAVLSVLDADPIITFYDEVKAEKKAGESKKARTEKTKTNGGSGGFDFNGAGGSVDYDEIIRNGAPNGHRSELFQATVWHLAAKGKTVEEIVTELARHINGIGAKYAGRLKEEVERSYTKWKEERTIPGDESESEQGPPPEPNTWDEVNKNGKPQPTCTNVKRALLNGLSVVLRRDVFHDRFLVEGKVVPDRDNLDHTVIDLRDKIKQAFDFDPSTQNVRDAVTMLCLRNEFDPVVDYLDALQWDGVPRLDRWLATYAGAADTELNREFGRLALIAAVRRARTPGCKFDPILVLEGRMGTGKSAIFELLGGAENFSDQTILGKHDREQQELLGGVWIFEIADLAGMKKAEVEHLKAFASRTHDRARPAYGHYLVSQPRRGIVVATTNNDDYLKEADRRFWPVKTATIDIEALRRDRDQLWAEAAQREREGVSIVLRPELWSPAGAEQLARQEHDPWDDIISDAGRFGEVEQGEERVSSQDLLSTVFGINKSNQAAFNYRRAAQCMKRLGWSGPGPIRIRSRVVTGYRRTAPPVL